MCIVRPGTARPFNVAIGTQRLINREPLPTAVRSLGTAQQAGAAARPEPSPTPAVPLCCSGGPNLGTTQQQFPEVPQILAGTATPQGAVHPYGSVLAGTSPRQPIIALGEAGKGGQLGTAPPKGMRAAEAQPALGHLTAKSFVQPLNNSVVCYGSSHWLHPQVTSCRAAAQPHHLQPEQSSS